MEAMVYLYLLLALAVLILSWMVYLIILKSTRNKKIRADIIELFNAQEYDDALKFEYKGYTMLATFRPEVKISIPHNREIKNFKAPKGMKLTPIFLIIKLRKRENIRERVEEGVNFLDSIPIQ